MTGRRGRGGGKQRERRERVTEEREKRNEVMNSEENQRGKTIPLK